METFELWLLRTGQSTKNVGAGVLARAAWEAALAKSRELDQKTC